jgi:hypothetical protein
MEYDTVDIWAGVIPRRATLEAFLAEEYDPDSDDEPISKFAAEQRQTFYDHDFVESSFVEREAPLEQMLRDHSYSKSYAAAADAVTGNELFNCVILVWGNQIHAPRSGLLKYVGRFASDATDA